MHYSSRRDVVVWTYAVIGDSCRRWNLVSRWSSAPFFAPTISSFSFTGRNTTRSEHIYIHTFGSIAAKQSTTCIVAAKEERNKRNRNDDLWRRWWKAIQWILPNRRLLWTWRVRKPPFRLPKKSVLHRRLVRMVTQRFGPAEVLDAMVMLSRWTPNGPSKARDPIAVWSPYS